MSIAALPIFSTSVPHVFTAEELDWWDVPPTAHLRARPPVGRKVAHHAAHRHLVWPEGGRVGAPALAGGTWLWGHLQASSEGKEGGARVLRWMQLCACLGKGGNCPAHRPSAGYGGTCQCQQLVGRCKGVVAVAAGPAGACLTMLYTMPPTLAAGGCRRCRRCRSRGGSSAPPAAYMRNGPCSRGDPAGCFHPAHVAPVRLRAHTPVAAHTATASVARSWSDSVGW